MNKHAGTESIGVLYAPFQVSEIPIEHSNIISNMLDHQHVVIALPVRKVSPTKNAPLDYAAREAMIRQYYDSNFLKYIHIVPVVDRKYAKDKVAALESAVRSVFSAPGSVRLYSDAEFVELYRKNNGSWATTAGDYIRSEQADWKDMSNLVADESFRRGAILAMKSQFPISWPTVDIAIRWTTKDKTVKYLFGKKPGERGWRFPGGFKDRSDPNFETAVWREAGEEVLHPGIDPLSVFGKPKYISSRNVNDWRYAGEVDGITTLFYVINFTGTEDQIKAGDDLAETKWFSLKELMPEDIEGEHIYLYEDLRTYEGEFGDESEDEEELPLCSECHELLDENNCCTNEDCRECTDYEEII